MRFVFLKVQSAGNVESGLEDKQTKGEKPAVILLLGMESKTQIRKSGRELKELCGLLTMEVEDLSHSGSLLQPQDLAEYSQVGKSRGLSDFQVSRLGGFKVVPLIRMSLGGKF